MIKFGIVGTGWRTEFFLRVAAAAPDNFQVQGLMGRNYEKAVSVGRAFGVPAVSSLDELLAFKPDLVVVSVSWAAAPEFILELSRRGIPVLCETPPAPGEKDLAELWEAIEALPQAKVEVAEQYHLQPLHAARLDAVRRGWIGTPSYAHVSAAHGYHGISLLRKYLGVGLECPKVSGQKLSAPITAGPGRDGGPETDEVRSSSQTLALFEWEGKAGVFDFSGDQYFSWIRSNHVCVRGEQGEIQDNSVRRLLDFKTPLTTELRREVAGETGNLEGMYLKGYTAGGEWLYENPLVGARLSDDEIAVGGCLLGLARYIGGGEPCYPLVEAMHDRYLDIWMERAVGLGEKLEVPSPPWG